DGRALTLMLPRGLAAAALASILAAQMPDAALGSMILDLTLLIILFSCITATLSAVGGRKREQDGADRLARTLAFDEEAEQTFLRRQRRRISSEESLSPKQP
ncbi:MAG TPA: hypothetical protein VI893_09620, partial [Thermoplasmata archaeon]|nr:hypothetical protein [Thermoplasmata archaeon]